MRERSTLFAYQLQPQCCIAAAEALLLLCQAPGVTLRQSAPQLYRQLCSKRVGYCTPIVNESVVFYDNRYTDQQYHAIDKQRTAEAFLKEWKYCLAKRKLGWVELADSLQSWLPREAVGDDGIDSIPPRARRALCRAGIDYVVVVYDVRLTHVQLVGTNQSDPLPAVGGSINRALSFKCSILDDASGALVYSREIRRQRSGMDLDLIEKAIGDLLGDSTGK